MNYVQDRHVIPQLVNRPLLVVGLSTKLHAPQERMAGGTPTSVDRTIAFCTRLVQKKKIKDRGAQASNSDKGRRDPIHSDV